MQNNCSYNNNHPYLNFSDLKDLIDKRELFGDKTAFRYFDKEKEINISAAQFKNDVYCLAAYLLSIGMTNKTIAVIGENSYQWIVVYFAVVNSGNIIVPIDKALPNDEIYLLLKKSEVSAFFYSNAYKKTVQDCNDILLLNTNSFDEYIKSGKEYIDNGHDEIINYKPDVDAVCAIVYTSGTTGTPKGVMLSHKSLTSDALGACSCVYVSGTSMLALPLHHTFAFTAAVIAELAYGYTISINWNLRHFKSDLKAFKPQNIFLVPMYVENMHKNIWNTAEKNNKDKILKTFIIISNALRKMGIDLRKKLFKNILSEFGGNLDVIISGGAYLDQKYIDAFEDFGLKVLNGFGITECSPVIAVNPNDAPRPGSVGKILPVCEIKTVENEICVKGDPVMLGYFKDQDATNEVFEDSWFKTGDLGYVKDGYLYITGRKKNLIIASNGKNVSPEELEAKIIEIPNVIEVVVYLEDNIITAEIYAENKDGIESGINRLNKNVASYKRINRIKFRETEFEKTTTMKIKRNLIK